MKDLFSIPSGTEINLTIDQLTTDIRSTLVGIDSGRHLIIKITEERKLKLFSPEQQLIAKYIS
ncbi:MAG: hypothetical protein HQK93_02630, partial [Nitrospirae bacterium]|nr:hypothetical protein [Nitrospirota bacterium]